MFLFGLFLNYYPRIDAHIVIVGSTQGVSYGPPPPQGSWSSIFYQRLRDSMIPQEFIY